MRGELLGSVAVSTLARLAVVTFLGCLLAPAARAEEATLDALLGDASEEAPETPDGNEASQSSEPTPPASRPTEPRRVLEEIVVTAQKVEQSLRDVPISISVLDADFLAERGVTDYRDLSLFAGNFKVENEGGTQPPPDIRIRGFGTSEANRAFEQSVGLSIDGDTFGQQEYFQGTLFDLERIEVLKGPQGTLFGKNTTAGLVNVVLAEPTDDLAGFVDLQYGELDRRRAEAAVSGPIVPNLVNFRISGLLDERDGLVGNTTARVVPEALDRLGGRDRQAIRAKLEFPDLFGARIRLTGEHSDFESIGMGNEITEVTVPAVRAFYEKYDPNVDTEAENYIGSVDLPDAGGRTIRRFAANGTYGLAGWGLDAILGHARLESNDLVDADLGPAPLGFAAANDSGNQTTVELRAASPRFTGLFGLTRLAGLTLGESELTGGFFFQRKRINTSTEVALNIPVLGEWTAAAEGVPPPPFGADANRALPTNSSISAFSQLTLSYAGFAQARWVPIERWTLEYGMRLTQETKEADLRRFSDTPESQAIYSALGLETFTLEGLEHSELGLTPKVALLHDVTDDVNLFATWGVGFKSGGFNENATSSNPERLTYDRETMRSWELGSKARWLGGVATTNAQLFWMEATDLQVYTVEPEAATFGLRGPVNVGKARARGAELDASWLPTDWLSLLGVLGFNDSEYLDFPFGTCEPDREDTDGDGDPRCALDGTPLTFTPKWDTTFVAGVRFPVGSASGVAMPLLRDLEVVGNVTVHYEDVHFLNRTNDPRTRQPSFMKVDVQLGLASPGQGWSLGITGQNLTNEVTQFIKRTQIVAGSFREINDPPRLWFGTFRWEL